MNLNIGRTVTPPSRSFYCTVWQIEKSGLPYRAAGTPPTDSPIQMWISCNHQPLGVFGINIRGEISPISNALIPAGHEFFNPSQFPDLKVCMKIRDLSTNEVLYCDYATYNSNISQCNVAILNPLGAVFFTVTSSGSPTATIVLHQPSLVTGANGYLVMAFSASEGTLPPISSVISPFYATFYPATGFDGTTFLLGITSGTVLYYYAVALGNTGVMSSTWTEVTHTS